MSRALLLLFRALRLRCPACGAGPLFRSWFKLTDTCPGCRFRFERDEGYFTGAMAINLIVAEGIFLGGLVIVLLLTWPDPPWTILQWGSIVLMLLLPFFFYPFSKTTWIAADILVRPLTRQDYEQPHDQITKPVPVASRD